MRPFAFVVGLMIVFVLSFVPSIVMAGTAVDVAVSVEAAPDEPVAEADVGGDTVLLAGCGWHPLRRGAGAVGAVGRGVGRGVRAVGRGVGRGVRAVGKGVLIVLPPYGRRCSIDSHSKTENGNQLVTRATTIQRRHGVVVREVSYELDENGCRIAKTFIKTRYRGRVACDDDAVANGA